MLWIQRSHGVCDEQAIVIDAFKRFPSRPARWVYGVSFRVEGGDIYHRAYELQRTEMLTMRLLKSKHLEYIAALALVIANVLRENPFGLTAITKVYICRDLTPPDELEFRVALERIVFRVLHRKIHVSLVTRSEARSTPKLFKLYQVAHSAAGRARVKNVKNLEREHKLLYKILRAVESMPRWRKK